MKSLLLGAGSALAFAFVFGLPVSASAAPHLVKELKPGVEGSSFRFLGAAGSSVVFIERPDDESSALWVSDGTAAGTKKLPWDDQIGTHNVGPAVTAGDTLYFGIAGSATTDAGVWRTDGTAAGTRRAAETARPIDLAVAGKYVLVNDGGSSSGRLNSIDTLSGTTRNGSSTNGGFGNFVTLGGAVYFTSFGNDGEELSKSDGTASGTGVVKVLDAPDVVSTAIAEQLVGSSNRLFFLRRSDEDDQLWTSDGTAAGTKQVTTFASPFGRSSPVIDHLTMGSNGLAYFRKVTNDERDELWRSDGTSAGTFSIGARLPKSSLHLGVFGTTKGFTFFCGDDGAKGTEMWKTDGTASGTEIFRDFVPGAEGARPDNGIASANGTFFFAVSQDGSGRQWHSSDGTSAGTKPIFATAASGFPLLAEDGYPDAPPVSEYALPVGDKFFFIYQTEAAGAELWVDDIVSSSDDPTQRADAGTRDGSSADDSDKDGSGSSRGSPGASSSTTSGCSVGTSMCETSPAFALGIGLAIAAFVRRRK